MSILANTALTAALSGSFSPASLFAAGEQGVWYDPSDLSTMFQDAAGTTPVTAVGQSVGLIRDKSGRGNHASQSVAGTLPTLQIDTSGRLFLLFDGTDDSLATSSIDFSATNKMTVLAGVRKLSDAATGFVVELSATLTANNGTFFLRAPNGAAANYYSETKGTTQVAAGTTNVYAAPITNVVSLSFNIGAPSAEMRVNAVSVSTSALTQGTGNYGNYPLYIGRRASASNAFNGRIYSLILRGDATSPAQIAAAERWVNAKTGAY